MFSFLLALIKGIVLLHNDVTIHIAFFLSFGTIFFTEIKV